MTEERFTSSQAVKKCVQLLYFYRVTIYNLKLLVLRASFA